tara:strand:+ start:1238 stop:1642 length:405 start_codon:yes stop_codon:yes gene_type:complete
MSTLKVNTIQDASGGNASTTSEIRSGILRAWINYDGYGASIRASYNISSVTDNGTGDYTFFIDTDFSDVNYCWTGTATTATGTETTLRNIAFSTASSGTSNAAHVVGSTRVSVATQNSAANLHDARQVMVQWVR